MMDWLAEYYLGMFGAWLATVIVARLRIWWNEAKADFKIELLDR